MSLILVCVPIILSIFVPLIKSDVNFCANDRKLLLGGVFRHRDVVYGNSWKEGHMNYILWTFTPKADGLTLSGNDTYVDKVFPGLPLFKSGFGLDLKCDKSDNKCNAYQDMVFIFFQNSYKSYKYLNGAFVAFDANDNLLWGLKGTGSQDIWTFGADISDLTVDGAAFITGIQPQVFMVSKDTLYSSPADITAKTLKWTKVNKNANLVDSLGGFAAGNELLYNKQAKQSLLYKYDTSGKDVGKTTVWKYFGCPESAASAAESAALGGVVVDGGGDRNKKKSMATIILICIVIAIVLTDIITALFWFAVYRKKRTNSS